MQEIIILSQFLKFPLLNFLLIIISILIKKKVLFCTSKSSKESKSFFQNMKLEMLNNLKDSLERKTAAVSASIDVLERQIERDKEN
tara:strand:+ start:72 stop:329 length:258 start_codon:yes stop_codon:yes gene_type:complete